MNALRSFFQLAKYKTTVSRELIAGLTTFTAMSYIPAFGVVALMCFTSNIAVGITAGLVLCPFSKMVAGKLGEVKPGLWALAALSLMFSIFYPYG